MHAERRARECRSARNTTSPLGCPLTARIDTIGIDRQNDRVAERNDGIDCVKGQAHIQDRNYAS